MRAGPSLADNNLGELVKIRGEHGRINYGREICEPGREIPVTPLDLI